jgi:hypothetical protein
MMTPKKARWFMRCGTTARHANAGRKKSSKQISSVAETKGTLLRIEIEKTPWVIFRAGVEGETQTQSSPRTFLRPKVRSSRWMNVM